MSEPKLLPCPFCGCEKPPTMQGNGVGDNWLECVKCGASTRLREDGVGCEKDWNTRAQQAAPVGYQLVPTEMNDAMQLAGAEAVRVDTTPINKLFIATRVYRAALEVARAKPEHGEG
ncbi:Lar family restriction alleviation protein [Ralstonia pickettii]|uniref:Lar family restriction alleviation protein n=1 Tax=Ralstonia pickettii TaxID=329 RepID=UPI0015F7E998|nr:Lar family restriction alleviation protein [Ralstonia pickettii]MBX4004566.1 Lar family restriction alleviation protein [Ralstonia pickettii]MBX4072916.1 Lar family restriction alleviation protein [Ralstonia pickettii]MBX4077873.1 Lar family restriction alleviation protein [Ralstonia pickettii]MBX4090964.1 Lar family restriction alleviation protein [Ralstonia pickettii]MBX4100794.1 Lar family restriction alleviation protein [Ralstonia pickettii]